METTNIIRLFLVDDHKIFVEGVARLFLPKDEVVVTGWSYSGEDALKCLEGEQPDVIITDLQMPGMSGIELAIQVKENFPQMKVIGLSMLEKGDIIKEWIATGAEGYLSKDIEKDELLTAIKRVHGGEYYFSSTIASVMLKATEQKDLLTAREREIIKLITDECSNAEISTRLFISEHTVESHRKNIFRKTGAKSIVGLVKFAIDNHLV